MNDNFAEEKQKCNVKFSHTILNKSEEKNLEFLRDFLFTIEKIRNFYGILLVF